MPEIEGLVKLYKEAQGIFEEKASLEKEVKGVENELRLAKEKVNRLQDEFSQKQYKVLVLDQQYHNLGATFVANAKEYDLAKRKEAEKYLEAARKSATVADNTRQEADDLLKLAKEKEAKANKLLEEASVQAKAKSRR